MAVSIQILGGPCTLVDDEDAERVRALSLYRAGNARCDLYYVGFRLNGRQLLLHRWLINAPAGLWVDHRDGVTTNNQKGNLRLATVRQNIANSKLSKASTSGFKGVHHLSGRWRAKIVSHGVPVFLGTFDTPEEAARAYDAAAVALFGEFARLNHDAPGYREALEAAVPAWHEARRAWLARPNKPGRKTGRESASPRPRPTAVVLPVATEAVEAERHVRRRLEITPAMVAAAQAAFRGQGYRAAARAAGINVAVLRERAVEFGLPVPGWAPRPWQQLSDVPAEFVFPAERA